jgi:hypothetical protein
MFIIITSFIHLKRLLPPVFSPSDSVLKMSVGGNRQGNRVEMVFEIPGPENRANGRGASDPSPSLESA